MKLFGGQRDMDLFNKVNKELINNIIDTEVYYYMVAVAQTKSNLYGEGKDKVFHNPIKVPCLVERNQASQISDEFGQSYEDEYNSNFKRYTCIKRPRYEVGDIIQWNNEYHLIGKSYSYQYFAGKNLNIGMVVTLKVLMYLLYVNTHVIEQSSIKLVGETRF